jgi:hypothetical protein
MKNKNLTAELSQEECCGMWCGAEGPSEKTEVRDILSVVRNRAELFRRLDPASDSVPGFSFLLKHGRAFTRVPAPQIRGSWNRKGRECFGNAFRNVLKDERRFAYCEGLTLSSSGLLFRHAWFCDRTTPVSAIDTTLPYDDDYSYLGVTFNMKYVSKLMCRGFYYQSVIADVDMDSSGLTARQSVADGLEAL